MVAITEKPFIHLIQMPYGWYVYDVNRDRILKVDQDVYAYLDAEQQGNHVAMKGLLPKVDKQIRIMKEGKFLSSSHPEEMYHPATDYIEAILSKKIEKITLQVTRQCNLRCKYCVYSEMNHEGQRKHSGDAMTWETAKAAIDFLAEHSYEERIVNIGFYGGEPLLNFGLIKKCVNYVQDVFEGKEISFSITSNGTVISSEIVEFLSLNKIQLTFSLDGPSEVHDKRRVFRDSNRSTFEKVMENLQWIKANYPDYSKTVSVNAVLDTSEDFGCVDSFFKTLSTQGNAALNLSTSFVDDTYSDEKKSFHEEFIPRMGYQYFNVLLALSGRYSPRKLSLIAQRNYETLRDKFENKPSVSILPKKTAPGGPCIAGKTRLFVDVFGNFFPCERVSETSKCMKIGNISDGFDITKILPLINISKLTPNECKDCFAFWHCTTCAKQCDNNGVLDADAKRTNCDNSRNIADSDLRSTIAVLEMRDSFN